MIKNNQAPDANDKKVGRQWLRFILGILALIIGSLVYLLDRPADSSLLIDQSISLFDKHSLLFGTIGQHLPTFSHPFAFILITAALMNSVKKASYFSICFTWLAIDSVFEIAQKETINQYLATYIPSLFTNLPLMSHLQNYFINGHYDPLDLFSILMGVIAAYIVLLTTEKMIKP